MTLLEALKKLQAKGYTKSREGICGHIEFMYDVDCSFYMDLYKIFKHWPKFSGMLHYPVPAAYYDNPKTEFTETDNLWQGAYGDLRKELLQFCIDELSKEVSPQDEC